MPLVTYTEDELVEACDKAVADDRSRRSVVVEGFEGTTNSLADYLEKVHGALRMAAFFLEKGAERAPDTAIDETIKSTGEKLQIRGLATTMRNNAVTLLSLVPSD